MKFKQVKRWECWDHAQAHGIIYKITGGDGIYIVYRKWVGGEACVGRADTLEKGIRMAELNFNDWLNGEQKDLTP